MKNYFKYIDALKGLALKRSYIKLKKIGKTGKYQMYRISMKGKGKIKVLISTGTHGDEPAGPKALLKFLSKNNSSLLKKFDFTIFPCINPYGYEHGTRKNAQKEDINRGFEKNKVKEVKIIKKFLKGKKFSLLMDLHEDWEYKGFYLYELSRGKMFSRQIISAVSKVCPINLRREIDGHPAKGGIIHPVEHQQDIGIKPLPRYVYKYHSEHIITCETPSSLGIEKRVNAHLTSLKTALRLLKI